MLRIFYVLLFLNEHLVFGQFFGHKNVNSISYQKRGFAGVTRPEFNGVRQQNNNKSKPLSHLQGRKALHSELRKVSQLPGNTSTLERFTKMTKTKSKFSKQEQLSRNRGSLALGTGDQQIPKRYRDIEVVHVEVSIWVDKKLLEYIQSSYTGEYWNRQGMTPPQSSFPGLTTETEIYVRKFMAAVGFRFEKQFSNPKIKFYISDIQFGKEAPFLEKGFLRDKFPYWIESPEAVNLNETLKKMAVYFGQYLKFGFESDIVIFMTNEKLCTQKCDKGLLYQNFARVKGACDMEEKPPRFWGVSIVQDFGGFSGVLNTVHAIGHLLGAGGNWDDAVYTHFLLDKRPNFARLRDTHAFSPHSIKSINTFLKSKAASCLLLKPSLEKQKKYPLKIWKELFAPNVPTMVEQCSTLPFTADKADLCDDEYYVNGNDRDPCQHLDCKSSDDQCQSLGPAMDGTRCDLLGNVCRGGKCIDGKTNMKPKKYKFWKFGPCHAPNGQEQTTGKIKLGAFSNKWDCLDACRTVTTKGCQFHISSGICYGHTYDVKHNWDGSRDVECFSFQTDFLPWRNDGRCGPKFPLRGAKGWEWMSGEPSQCNPMGQDILDGPCCSDKGQCGNTESHCFCKKCENYGYCPYDMVLYKEKCYKFYSVFSWTNHNKEEAYDKCKDHLQAKLLDWKRLPAESTEWDGILKTIVPPGNIRVLGRIEKSAAYCMELDTKSSTWRNTEPNNCDGPYGFICVRDNSSDIQQLKRIDTQTGSIVEAQTVGRITMKICGSFPPGKDGKYSPESCCTAFSLNGNQRMENNALQSFSGAGLGTCNRFSFIGDISVEIELAGNDGWYPMFIDLYFVHDKPVRCRVKKWLDNGKDAEGPGHLLVRCHET